MKGKNSVSSFSYNEKDSEIIDECIRMARMDGISFSEFIVACLKEQVSRKKAIGEANPINISYGNEIKKHFPRQLNLNEWLDHISIIQEPKELNKLKGQALELARRVDRRSMELYRKGIRS